MRSRSSQRSRAALAAALLAFAAAGVWASACDLNPQPIPPGLTGEDAGAERSDAANAPTNMGDDASGGGGAFGDVDAASDGSPVPPFEGGAPADAGDGGRLDAGDAGDGGDAQ